MTVIPTQEPPVGSRIWWVREERTETGRIAGVAWGNLAIRLESGWLCGGASHVRWEWEEMVSRADFLGGATEFVILPPAVLQI